jgi:hypothetical protein
VGTHTTYDDLGPGLHVLRELEPLKRAGAMAAQMHADLCATLPQADAALAERTSLPAADASTLSTLQGLGRRLARAERIASRTRARAVADVEHRLAATGAGLAVHPTTIRERAGAVDSARAELAAAQRAVDEHAARLVAAEEEAQREAAEAAAHAAAPADAEGGGPVASPRRFRAIGLLVAGFGVALVLLALQVAAWAALLPPLVAALVSLRLLRPPEHDEDDAEDRREASSLLSQIAASTDELFGARRAARELEEQSALLQARRGRAEEELRVAERAWQDLAGEGVDVSELEEVIRRFDPQHEDARLLADETVGVRTVEVVLHQVEQTWLAAWRELGLDAPAAVEAEAAVRDLAARVSRPIVLVGPATERAEDLALAAPAAPVVVLEGPSDGEVAVEQSAS